MAERKSPQVDPVPDSSQADNTILVVNTLQPSDFNRYIRMCFEGRVDSVRQVGETAKIHLDRLGVKPDLKKAVTSNPQDASANVNPQSLFIWMGKLEKKHKRAVNQLKTLHATASRRLGV